MKTWWGWITLKVEPLVYIATVAMWIIAVMVVKHAFDVGI